MGEGLNWEVGEQGICLRISHKTGVGKMDLNHQDMGHSRNGVTLVPSHLLVICHACPVPCNKYLIYIHL